LPEALGLLPKPSGRLPEPPADTRFQMTGIRLAR
jgi:hypothetical protein